jgi:hypothetical protein
MNNDNTDLVTIQVPRKFVEAILAYSCSLQDGNQSPVLSERLESIGIKLTKEIETLVNKHPENLEYAIACASENWVKNPLAVFKKRLIEGGELQERSHSLVKSAPNNIQSTQQHNTAQMVLVREIMSETELIEYKATEWKTDPKSGFHHKELEFVKADVISSYLNNPIRLELDRAAMVAVKERKQREFEREQAEIARLKAIEEEVKALTPEQRKSNIDRIKQALNGFLNSPLNREEVLF